MRTIFVFFSDSSNFHKLQAYRAVSNARFNQHKTETFDLDGLLRSTWQTLF
ncbi:hypothetical protein BD560DRAFT_331927 [Blakeslea trispora]|nr:hypothetical protein BD560DRAFT_331927 [Blakeslea trispora]